MSGKTNRKHRRNQKFCEQYEKSGRRETNKEAKLMRHQLAHPADIIAAGKVNYTRRKSMSAVEKHCDNIKNHRS